MWTMKNEIDGPERHILEKKNSEAGGIPKAVTNQTARVLCVKMVIEQRKQSWVRANSVPCLLLVYSMADKLIRQRDTHPWNICN